MERVPFHESVLYAMEMVEEPEDLLPIAELFRTTLVPENHINDMSWTFAMNHRAFISVRGTNSTLESMEDVCKKMESHTFPKLPFHEAIGPVTAKFSNGTETQKKIVVELLQITAAPTEDLCAYMDHLAAKCFPAAA